MCMGVYSDHSSMALHTHCLGTIAVGYDTDACDLVLTSLLKGFRWEARVRPSLGVWFNSKG